MKRFSFVFLCLILCCSLVFGCISVSASTSSVDGRTVVNYLDYVKGYDLTYAGDGWAFIRFDDSMFTSYKQDVNGYAESLSGSRLWNLKIPNDDAFTSFAVSQIPGGSVNNTFLELSNIPTGSRFQIHAFADILNIDTFQSEFLVSINSGVTYYDSNFNKISDHISEQVTYSFDTSERFSQLVEIALNIPDNATYCSLYTRCNFAIGRTNDVDLDFLELSFQFSEPNLKISTSYTQIIIQSIIQAKPPAGAGTIIDLDEMEDILNGSTGDGKEQAEELFETAPEVIEQYLSGFLFLNAVFSSFLASNWLSSVLIVSLSLGLFAYIVNAAGSAGQAIERRSRGGGKK